VPSVADTQILYFPNLAFLLESFSRTKITKLKEKKITRPRATKTFKKKRWNKVDPIIATSQQTKFINTLEFLLS
jgi:hypothetical protein